MTVSELIRELQSLPPYLPVLCNGIRVEESIFGVDTRNVHGKTGPVAIITTVQDRRNDADATDYYLAHSFS